MQLAPRSVRRHAAGLALAIGVIGTAPAHAADGFLASVTTQFFGSSSDGVSRGDRIAQKLTVTSLPGHPIAFTEQNVASDLGAAKSHGHASGNASAGHVGAAVDGGVAASAFRAQADLSVAATSTVNDVLTIPVSGGFTFGQHILMTNFLELDGSDEQSTRFNAGNTNGHFFDFVTGAVNAGVAVSGTGIDPGPGNVNVVGSTFASFDFSQGIRSAVVNPPSRIKLVLDVTVGIPKFTTLSIAVNGIGLVSDSDNSPTNLDGFANFSAQFGETLKWGRTTTFTDAVTGEVLHDVTVTAASGFDYAHPTFATGAVPEPTTWALLLGGFGAVGLTARRRRTACTLGETA